METTTEEPQHKLIQFRDQEPERRYWRIGQVAVKLGVSTSMLRFMERSGVCKPFIKTTGKKTERFFTQDQLERLRLAKELQDAGMKLRLVKRLLREHRAQHFIDQLNPQCA